LKFVIYLTLWDFEKGGYSLSSFLIVNIFACGYNNLMDKKYVLITGAASGIGYASAKKFAADGWFVFGLDINENGLQMLKSEIGDDFEYFVCDVSGVEQIADAITKIGEKTGGTLDTLVSNAGILIQKEFAESELTDYRRMIDINAFGMVNLIYASLPLLKNTARQSKRASIVLTSSSSAEVGVPLFAVYSATKGFIKNLTEGLSGEFKGYNIAVNDVMPHFTNTGMVADMHDTYRKQSTLTPEQIADVIFKASFGNKRHYRVGGATKMIHIANKLLPQSVVQKMVAKNIELKQAQSKE
jgi:short-subunit dehydrogenase